MSRSEWLSPVARVLIISASLVIVIAGLRAAEALLIPLLIAAFLTIICSPAVGWLVERKVPMFLAVLLVVLVLMFVLFVIGAMIGNSVAELTAALPRYQARFDELIRVSVDWLAEKGWEVDPGELRSTFNTGSILRAFARGLSSVATVASNSFLVFFTLIFMLLETAYLPSKVRAMKGNLESSFAPYQRISKQVQRYLALKTLVSFLTGLSVTIWVAAVGLDFPLVWGMIAFFLNFIPTIGSIIAAVPAVILALIQLGPFASSLVIIGYLVANVTMGNLVEPRLMGQTLGLSTLVVFVSLVFWGWVWGTIGMLLSIPLTMIFKIVLETYPPTRGLAILLSDERSIRAELTLLEKIREANKG
jgi:predicted PurR-regulated permease PerM